MPPGEAEAAARARPREGARKNANQGEIMDRTVRCTVCSWRGPMDVAESAPRLRVAARAPLEEEIQAAYEAQQAVSAAIGAPVLPPCPMCGNHTVTVKLHGYRAAG